MTEKSSAPLVSVVIPTYNCARYLGEAIESVLAQTHRPLEIVIVDDGSTDGTDRLVAAYGDRLRYIRQANAGASAARNRGIREAGGGWIAFLDADDTWMDRKLERQLALAAAHPEAGLVFTDACWFDEHGVRVPSWTARRPRFREGQALPPGGWYVGQPYEALLLQNFVTTSSALVRREALEGAGGFDPTFHISHDHDLWLRLVAGGPVGYVHEVLVRYQVRGESLVHSDFARMYLEEIRVVEEGARRAPADRPVRRRAWRTRLGELHGRLAWRFFHAGELARARFHFRASLAWWPWRTHPYLYLPFTFMPPGGLRALREAKQRLSRTGGRAEAPAANG
jgi:glycosyltransferase involved in cell wall biosynthesis